MPCPIGDQVLVHKPKADKDAKESDGERGELSFIMGGVQKADLNSETLNAPVTHPYPIPPAARNTPKHRISGSYCRRLLKKRGRKKEQATDEEVTELPSLWEESMKAFEKFCS